jgi:hypothetical protein
MSCEDLAAVVLPASLDLLAAEALCSELHAKILAAEPVVVDGRGVERVSTSCVQV